MNITFVNLQTSRAFSIISFVDRVVLRNDSFENNSGKYLWYNSSETRSRNATNLSDGSFATHKNIEITMNYYLNKYL